MRSVYASAGEAETAALFKCAQDMKPLRNALAEMGWPQPKSPIQVDNSTAKGFANNTIIIKRMRALEMRLNWLKCREAQEQFVSFGTKALETKAITTLNTIQPNIILIIDHHTQGESSNLFPHKHKQHGGYPILHFFFFHAIFNIIYVVRTT
jgi:hypothetical protein